MSIIFPKPKSPDSLRGTRGTAKIRGRSVGDGKSRAPIDPVGPLARSNIQNPLTAAVAIATLKHIADGSISSFRLCRCCSYCVVSGKPQEVAAARAEQLRNGINKAMQEFHIPGCCYGDSSVYHISFGLFVVRSLSIVGFSYFLCF